MMSEKRFECVFIEDDEFGGTFRRLKDNETGIMHMTCDVVDLLNFQNTQIKILKEENEQLKRQNIQSKREESLNLKDYVETDERGHIVKVKLVDYIDDLIYERLNKKLEG